MSSIALFYSSFCKEDEIVDQLASITGYPVFRDNDLVRATAARFHLDEGKVERALMGSTSVFNSFTLERETLLAQMKIALAEEIQQAHRIFTGFHALLLPGAITHLLRVGIFDERKSRIKRAISAGLSERQAIKLIKKNDNRTGELVHFLHKKPANDRSLYDIYLPMGETTMEEAMHIIVENYRKPALLETPESMQAVIDMQLAAQVELALLKKGHTNKVQCTDANITISIDTCCHNFESTANSLTNIAEAVSGVRQVEVVAGKDYQLSIYRDYKFELPPKVLLVDDEQEFVQTLSQRLNIRHYGSYPVFDGEQALTLLETETPDVMVLDLKMPGIQGVEVLKKTKESKPDTEVIILTGHGSEENRKECMELGAYAYLHKPIDFTELTATIDQAYKKVAATKIAHTASN